MKILHLYRDLWADGGIPYQTRCLIEGQIKAGSTLISLAKKGNAPETWPRLLHQNHFPVLASGLQSLFQLREILKAHKPDIVHITGLWIPIHQLWALEVSRKKIPYIVSTHGNLSPHGMNVRFGEKKQILSRIWAKKIWHRFLDLPLLRNAAGVHVHSLYEMDLVKAAGMKKAFIAPNGIQSEWVGTHNSKPRKLHNPITFLHLGRLDIYHKGLDIICEALRNYKATRLQRPYKFIFVGPTVNDSKRTLERLASQIDGNVLEIRHPVSGKEKEALWKEADYFLNLYRFGGMAIAPSEAIAKGLPLIVSREGNFGDLTLAEDLGFVVPLASPILMETIDHVLRLSNDEYQIMSGNVLKIAKTLTWEHSARETEKGYQNFKG